MMSQQPTRFVIVTSWSSIRGSEWKEGGILVIITAVSDIHPWNIRSRKNQSQPCIRGSRVLGTIDLGRKRETNFWSSGSVECRDIGTSYIEGWEQNYTQKNLLTRLLIVVHIMSRCLVSSKYSFQFIFPIVTGLMYMTRLPRWLIAFSNVPCSLSTKT